MQLDEVYSKQKPQYKDNKSLKSNIAPGKQNFAENYAPKGLTITKRTARDKKKGNIDPETKGKLKDKE